MTKHTRSPRAATVIAGTSMAFALGCSLALSARALPRTPDGKPDLQSNWTNETQTPPERIGAARGTLTDEQAAAMEKRAQTVEAFRDRPSDPKRPAPPKSGESGRMAAPGQPSFIEQHEEVL